MKESWNKQKYDEQLHTDFKISDNRGGIVTVELVEVKQHENKQSASLSLLFHGPSEPMLDQSTHLVSHPVIGEMQIFMGPINRPLMKGTFYEAVFSRLKE